MHKFKVGDILVLKEHKQSPDMMKLYWIITATLPNGLYEADIHSFRQRKVIGTRRTFKNNAFDDCELDLTYRSRVEFNKELREILK